ncbi:hypothetical protein [Thermococcus sibiricus]|uniref:Putative glutamine amidotransferase n=1 Tax=Thermococcus sibiricus TaxID=172049 RepID=A0A101ELS5_9EURY|nr:hypothetical protein [Thermococcus sibiricus]KUK17731.1 MAG: putative glutamine amidotransferase [Thermococcus sibiricus]
MKAIIGIVASFNWETGALTINDTYVRRVKEVGGDSCCNPTTFRDSRCFGSYRWYYPP